MINSAVRSSRLQRGNDRRRNSASSAILSRQAERICNYAGDEESGNDNGNDGFSLPQTDAAISASLGIRPNNGSSSRIHPELLAASSRQRPLARSKSSSIRHTIARKLKASREETETETETDDFGGDANDSASDGLVPEAPTDLSNDAHTSVQGARDLPEVGAGQRKGTFYVPNKKPWYIILPHNKYRTGWDIFMAWLLSILAFYIPFRVCFYFDSADSDRKAIFWIELGADCLFVIDIVLNFLTAYGDPKTKIMIVDPKKIAKRYLTGFFFVDVIATFPFGLVLSHQSLGLTNKFGKFGRLPKLLKFLRAAKLLKLVRLQHFISRLEMEYNIHHGVTRMIKVISLVFLVTHVVACAFYLIGLSGGTDLDDGGWMYRFEFNEKPVAARYVASLYWSFSTLTTVGYGDISARTAQEQAFSMAMMLVGVSWYAICVSSMSAIMSTFDAQNKAIRDKMLSVNSFIRAAKLPPPLAHRIRSYFEFRSTQKAFAMNSHYDADELLEEVGSALRTEILLHLERDLIEKIPFFDGKVPQFVADSISMLQPMVFQVGDIIVREGSQADEMYFLISGRAAVFSGETEVLTIDAGSYFGEVGCILGGIRRASIKALSVVELQALSRRNLNILLNEYPEVAVELKGVAMHRANLAKDLSSSSEVETVTAAATAVAPSDADSIATSPVAVREADASTSHMSLVGHDSAATINNNPDELNVNVQQLASLVSQLEQAIQTLNGSNSNNTNTSNNNNPATATATN
mmetsp:Transcript_18439/g.39934  ORF Transcript_18439/g.39934 Transcript_18439/m.39934 type:complete len:750 (-) Transcript_18439:98-2347(-)